MAMSKSLVIVESPAKAKTIEKYLGKGFEVLASVGHIMDLPKNDIGVELEHRTFEPTLIVSPGKEKVVAQLKKAAARRTIFFWRLTRTAKARRLRITLRCSWEDRE
jgi:DNA topoisomerase-1